MGYCIYKICCDDCDYVYVGSTQNFTNRKCQHKTDCNNENKKSYNLKLYQTIRENGGWDNWRMVCVEELGDVKKREAEMREEFWRQNLKANLNTNKPYTSEEEKKEYKKDYYKQNRDKIAEQHKKYREQNIDKISEQHKKYREQNRNKISEQRKEKIVCECGCVSTIYNLAKHKKTKKHQAWEWRQTLYTE